MWGPTAPAQFWLGQCWCDRSPSTSHQAATFDFPLTDKIPHPIPDERVHLLLSPDPLTWHQPVLVLPQELLCVGSLCPGHLQAVDQKDHFSSVQLLWELCASAWSLLPRSAAESLLFCRAAFPQLGWGESMKQKAEKVISASW